MTTKQIPPVVSTRIDISGQPMTRTDLLALFAAYSRAEDYRVQCGRDRFGTNDERAEYKAASQAALAAHQAMLDGISALDIPA